MVSFRTALLALATAIVVTADYYIEPESVSLSMRMAWCNNELSTCPLICQQVSPGTTLVNTCDPETLTYGCLCGNNLQPNVSEYSLTLPYHVCQQWGIQCVSDCGSNNECASSCQQDHPCGAQSPIKANSTTSSAMPSTSAGPTTTANQVFTGLAGEATSTSTPAGSAAPAVLRLGNAYGLAIVMGSLFAGFAMAL
ncbi:hypothetical protein B0T25DRAFT_573541 [Lasiosphaeria hispida]|uniref:DUF7707 domain-containing protein n=1 Tax=Lasiosphaeria hispida TaxID=260671 RepID=A0AAJ0H672_9PEZI|nr:hypothetical protein B0T25DRAFT_573541 [Lasiosphaeria hispida]